MVYGGSLDTNILLRLLLNDIPTEHDAVVELLERAQAPFLVCDTAIIEIIFVLVKQYGYTRLQVEEVVKGLIALPELRTNREVFELALSEYASRPALSFEDCYLAASAELAGATPLWTFDRKLANQLEVAKHLI